MRFDQEIGRTKRRRGEFIYWEMFNVLSDGQVLGYCVTHHLSMYEHHRHVVAKELRAARRKLMIEVQVQEADIKGGTYYERQATA